MLPTNTSNKQTHNIHRPS